MCRKNLILGIAMIAAALGILLSLLISSAFLKVVVMLGLLISGILVLIK